LHASSIDAAKGPLAAAAFVFDMNKVFEDFVTTAFTESMAKHGGIVRPQVEEFSLDIDSRLRLKPDLSWWEGDWCRAILDAKYKAIGDGVMRHDDAYQMLAYCTAYDLPRGYLVYARDSGEEWRTHTVRNAGCEIVVAAVDVENEPEYVLAEIDVLADEVALGAAQLAA
jgi:5-methylcytosine-specific restriction enzyme subunit McrC